MKLLVYFTLYLAPYYKKSSINTDNYYEDSRIVFFVITKDRLAVPLTIGSNISSLSAQRRLAEGTSQLSKTFERLSSGQRINSASDDAAGLSISESLKSDRRVFNQGVRNLNDGISLLTIADSAIESLSNITVRLKELAEQSANGSYSSRQRQAIDKEAQSLSKEFTRIVQTTKFNNVSLLNGGLGSGVRFQGGYGTDGGIFSGIGGGIGNGAFATAVTSNTGITDGVALMDLNGDGNLDRVGSNGSYILVSLGNGAGSFGPITTYSDGLSDSFDFDVGDVTGDGIMDIVMAGTDGAGTFGYDGVISVLIGNANGTFNTVKTYAVSGDQRGISNISIGDINGDGVGDIVASGSYYSFGTARGAIFYGKSSGNFTQDLSLTGYESSQETSLADLNGDGLVDYISTASGLATIRLNNGSGSFGAAQTYSIFGTIGVNHILGDVNNDGNIDIVGQGTFGFTSVLLGQGNGSFSSPTSFQVGGQATGMGLADFNGDGNIDIATFYNNYTIAFGNGNGTFGTGTSYSATGSYGSIGDINNDGVVDLVTTNATILGGKVDGAGPLEAFNLATLAGARQALPVFDRKIQQLSEQRGKIGAFQARTNVAINVLQASSENYAAAESRIRDADIADESSKLLRLNILQKAASSVLAQANLQPEIALKLLKV